MRYQHATDDNDLAIAGKINSLIGDSKRAKTREAKRLRCRSSTKRSRQLPSYEAIATERATGIEPAFSAWEADVLPLNYARGERPR